MESGPFRGLSKLLLPETLCLTRHWLPVELDNTNSYIYIYIYLFRGDRASSISQATRINGCNHACLPLPPNAAGHHQSSKSLSLTYCLSTYHPSTLEADDYHENPSLVCYCPWYWEKYLELLLELYQNRETPATFANMSMYFTERHMIISLYIYVYMILHVGCTSLLYYVPC